MGYMATWQVEGYKEKHTEWPNDSTKERAELLKKKMYEDWGEQLIFFKIEKI